MGPRSRRERGLPTCIMSVMFLKLSFHWKFDELAQAFLEPVCEGEILI